MISNLRHVPPALCLFALLSAAACGLLIGCGPNSNSTQSTSVRDAGASLDEASMDLGEDWERPGSGDRGQRSANGRAASNAPSQQGRWSIVLGTFAGDNHLQEARAVHHQVTGSISELASARVHSTERGSMLVYGRYESHDDPRASKDLERIKQVTVNDMPIFGRAFLTPLPASRTERSNQSSSSQYDLMSVRERYPDMHPLYTLQVAIWGDFDSDSLTLEQIRRNAEADVQRLRADGHEAYVFHDEQQQQSMVMIGLFNRNAINSKTGEFSPELRQLMRQFPAHMVNGEELLEPIDRRRPNRGTRVQRPSLVIVPRLH